MVWPAAGAGPAKLALAVQELGSTRLAPSRRDGAADTYIDNAYGDSPPPHVVWDLAKGSEGGDVCHVFGSAWQTLRSVRCSGWGW